jgi:hypothetical protein
MGNIPPSIHGYFPSMCTITVPGGCAPRFVHFQAVYEPQEDELVMHRDPGDVSLDMGLSEEAAQAGIACAFLISTGFRSS